MSYQSFPSPLPSPPADGHSLPFLPAKRLDLLRQAGIMRSTLPRRQSSWVVSSPESDGDSECSDDSQGGKARSDRVMSIPTIVLTPPQSPVSQFLLSEEDIQSSLNANQRRERLFGFGTRLTGLGEKMGMMNIASSFSNNSYTACDSPSPVTRSRSVSPPPVSVTAPRRAQQQQIRYSPSFNHGSPTKDGRRASADCFQPQEYNPSQCDEVTPPEIVCPSPIKINIIPPRAAVASPVTPEAVCSTQSPSPVSRGIRRPRLVRADRSADMATMDSGRFDVVPVKQTSSSWTPMQIGNISVDKPAPTSTRHNSRRKSHPPTLPSPVTTPNALAAATSFDQSTINGNSTHFRAFPEPVIPWTRMKASPYRFKSYLFLLIPLVFVFLHIYYLSVDRQFMRAGHAMVFGKPITATTFWSSGDAMLIDEHIAGFVDTLDLDINREEVQASYPDRYDSDTDDSNDEYHASQNSHATKNGRKHRGGQGRWLRRTTA